MANVSSSHRSMVFALLATTAAASLLGACNQTGKLFSGSQSEVKMTAAEAANATSRWAVAYAKDPQDPKMALGYAKALRSIGSKDQALRILKTAYRADPSNGEVAAELGRVALDMGRIDIASHALKSAESQGVTDWRTLSAQGALRAKKGQHSEAQQYFLAALEKQPGSVSVINNLALSYTLDGKAQQAEALLRKTTADGAGDKRIRQNLALVLGVQGKFSEAQEIASVDMSENQTKSSIAYLRNMISRPKQVAEASVHDAEPLSDWSPFGSSNPVKEAVSPQKGSDVKTATKAGRPDLEPQQQGVVAKSVKSSSTAKVARAEPAKPVKATVGAVPEFRGSMNQ